MKAPIAIVGIVILLVGVGLLAYGFAGGSSTTNNTSVTAIPATSRSIDPLGVWTAGSHTFTGGQAVTGTYSLASYDSSKGPVSFLVLNESQWATWGGCYPCTSPNLLNKSITSSLSNSFSWSAPYSGAFYFVIDDSSYNASATASFAANTTQMTTTNSSTNPTYVYSGVGLAIVGAIILAAGVIIPGKKR